MFTRASGIVMAVLLACCLAGISTSVAKEPPNPSTQRKNRKLISPKKPKEWDLRKQFSNQTASGKKTVRATDIDAETIKRPLVYYNPSQIIKIQGRPLLWWNDKHEAVVDKKYFSDLKAMDARRLKRGDRAKVVGRYLGGDELRPDQIVELLIRSEIVRCRIQHSATVTLVGSTKKDGYYARLSVTNVYYTMKRHETHFSFGIHIDKDGAIRLTKD